MVVIIVDKEKCTGCGECISVCPSAVYEFDEDGKSEPVNAEDCIECCSCVEVCPVEAIYIDACE
jgi:NAD-dependent dihydropyrimidine dehydrogenase PreA subunit